MDKTTSREDPQALNRAAAAAMDSGDFTAARGFLQRALASAPGNPTILLNLASCCRGANDLSGAFAALDHVLRVDGRNFHALLMKASIVEQQGGARQAAELYGAAIAQAPPERFLDPNTLRMLQHARDTHRRHVEELDAFVRQRLGVTGRAVSAGEARRVDSFLATTLRVRRRFQQQPTDYFFPGLAGIEFHDRDLFPWLPELEANTAAIGKELAEILAEGVEDFSPYVDYPEHLPLDQWAGLNRSRKWSAFHLLHQGKRVAKNADRCPSTMAALERLPQPAIDLRCPAAMFSALQPRTRIPPHTGVANFRLVVHLPLIVPAGCGFRVGGETREWRVGEAWVFDDTIEHEAWNDSDEMRVIFICDVWNPSLSIAEREMISEIIAASDEYNGVVPSQGL